MKLITILWRDIPSQIIVKSGRNKAKKQLSNRFQVAVDRAAMRAGKGSSDAYLEGWQRQTRQMDSSEDLESVAAVSAAEIESRFTIDDLETLIKNKGFRDLTTATTPSVALHVAETEAEKIPLGDFS